MSVTQKQIAEKLNVSRSLVAHALHGRDDVSPAMRERILATAREMGYNSGANTAARSLIARRYGKRVKKGIIALVFPATQESEPRYHPFFTPFFNGMEKEAAKRDLEVCSCWMRPGELPRLIREHGVDGVISLGAFPEDVAAVRQLDLPMVTCQGVCDGAHSVVPDDLEGGRLATRHLIELGHRDIAYLGVRLTSDVGGLPAALRLQGYREVMAEHGLPVREEWIETDFYLPEVTENGYCAGCDRCAACMGWSSLKTRTGINEETALPFTAVLCHNDLIAMGLIDHARTDGIESPRDLSIVGFDDISHRYYFRPEITSITSSRYDMGRSAVQILSEAIESNEGETTCRTFPVELVQHSTTAMPLLGGPRLGETAPATVLQTG